MFIKISKKGYYFSNLVNVNQNIFSYIKLINKEKKNFVVLIVFGVWENRYF